MTEFLLELYSEEIPARMQEKAAMELANRIGSTSNTKYYYTPQRLVVVADLAENQADSVIDRRGPRVGAPQQAVDGFLKSVGLDDISKAEQIEVKGEKYYYYKNTVKGEPTAAHLAKLLPAILNDFTWPKSMRWGAGEIRWVRPLHSIIALFGGKVVPFKFGHVVSGDVAVGHRFLDRSEFRVSSFEKYVTELKNRKVILDPEERKKIILEQARKLAGNFKLDEDQRLLNEVANLVEYPVVLLGTFDKEFLSVPQECLIATMKNNQKYFPLFQGEKLANKFIVVANKEDISGKIIAGNERVIKARLSDAKFFWEQDRKQKLETHIPKLETVVFHAKVGNMHDKAKHMAELAKFIANIIGADPKKAARAAYLAKADLVTGMVQEFPELQGIMGAYYAENDEGADVALAIKQHYLPAGQDDLTPTAPISICVALADKLYSLVQLWEAGEKPTGSRDPFALRRAALGVIQIILDNNLKLSLKSLIIQASKSGETGSGEIFDFFIERMKYLLKAQNIRHDYIAAVLDGKSDDLLSLKNKAEALGKFLSTETGAHLLAAYKRAANILAIEEKKDKKTYAPEPQKELLEVAEEKDLFAVIADSEKVIAAALNTEDFGAAMAALAKLQPYVNAFFDKVTVNAENAKTRENRLKLLAKIRSYMETTADFVKIEG